MKRVLSIVLFCASSCGGGLQTMSLTPDRIQAIADGNDTIVVTAVQRVNGEPFRGQNTVQFNVDGDAVVLPATVRADANGVATASVTSTVPGSFRVSASLAGVRGAESPRVESTITVEFQPR